MTCRRVFSNNNDMSYSNYNKLKKQEYTPKKIKKNKQNILCYLNCNIPKHPIHIIDGNISVYTNISDISSNNCIECVNSTNLCDSNICNSKVLYPHGKYVNKTYNKCKLICNNNDDQLDTLVFDLNRYYTNNIINTSTISSLNNTTTITTTTITRINNTTCDDIDKLNLHNDCTTNKINLCI